MAIKNALRLRENLKPTSAGLATLKTKPVEAGKLYCLQQVAWEIDTILSGGNDRARLYIDGHGYKHNLAEEDDPEADQLYTYDEDMWLIPGESLALDLDQAQANTTVELIATGYWTTTDQGIS